GLRIVEQRAIIGYYEIAELNLWKRFNQLLDNPPSYQDQPAAGVSQSLEGCDRFFVDDAIGREGSVVICGECLVLHKYSWPFGEQFRCHLRQHGGALYVLFSCSFQLSECAVSQPVVSRGR